VIREADVERKQSEFMAWALDVKKVNVEALARWEEKELFKEFVEDFNTGTLPHRWGGDGVLRGGNGVEPLRDCSFDYRSQR
jgi:hypothetical protein